MTTLLPACLCGGEALEAHTIHGLPMLRCPACGAHRQDVPMSAAELGEWYASQYFAGTYYHTKAHDTLVARERLQAYRNNGALFRKAKILDVGAGNGAFVEAAREEHYDAWGQDLAMQSASDHVYVGALEDIGFPTDEFDVVTVHDVLEHVPSPAQFLREAARVCKPGGTLIVDFPRFWHEAGVHHWKPTQHLWMLTEAQLEALVAACGFTLVRTEFPIPSKVVVYAQRNKEARLKILTPAGIGDTYWSMTKLPGLLRSLGRGGEVADLYVQDSGGPKRTEPFVRTLPSVHAAGYKWLPAAHPLFHEAYMRDARTVFKDVLDVDYFVAYNGVMRFGKRLEDVDPAFGVDWWPKMFVSKEALAMQARLEALGPYVVVYIVNSGMYRHWLSEFPLAHIREVVNAIAKEFGLKVVVVGASWDKGSGGEQMASLEPAWINLTDQTTYDQLHGVLRGASLVFGWPSGLSILGPVLRKPTMMFWNSYFVEGFWHAACPPSGTYRPMSTYRVRIDTVLGTVRELLTAGR